MSVFHDKDAIGYSVCTVNDVNFNIYELDYKRIHFVASADTFQREREAPPTHDSDWLWYLIDAVTSRVVWTRC